MHLMGFLDRLLSRGGAAQSVHKLNACVLHAGGLVGIVGESHRQDELRKLAAKTLDASAFRADLVDYAAEVADDEPNRRWFMAVLVREPDNEYDRNAIAVWAQGGGQLGYLRREDARAYGQVFESLEKRGYDAAACPAMLIGGGGKSYGVVLALSAPGYVLNDLTADERKASRESRAREKDARSRALYEAALAGETWRAIADAHSYETPGGAYAAASAYAKQNNLELPKRDRGPRKGADRN